MYKNLHGNLHFCNIDDIKLKSFKVFFATMYIDLLNGTKLHKREIVFYDNQKPLIKSDYFPRQCYIIK